MSRSEAELVAEMASYLRDRFPASDVRENRDRSRDVLELRIREPGRGLTLLVEIPSGVLTDLCTGDLARSLDDRQLAPTLREHLRVRITAGGLEPLPWKQLEAERDIFEETSEASFPASDSPGFSAVTPGEPR
jgi:hypothetical protein